MAQDLAAAGGEEDFGEWLKAKGINDATKTLLADQGFIDANALGVLQISDITSLKIKQLAQRRLLERLVSEITPNPGNISLPAAGQQIPVSTEKPDSSSLARLDLAGTIPNALGQGITAGTTNNAQTQSSVVEGHSRSSQDTGPGDTATSVSPGTHLQMLGINGSAVFRGDLNPLVYLSDTTKADYLDVADFVPALWCEADEQLLSSAEGSEVILKTGPKKPKIEHITQMQWTAANARILARLLLEGKLGYDNVANYLAYTVKVASLSQRYVWSSIMLYDREYRRAQAAYAFPWGSDVQHLVSVHLIPKQEKMSKPSSSAKYTVKREQTGSKNTGYLKPYPCKLYNEGRCSFGLNCRFAHECNQCKGPHPGSEHNK